MLVARPELSDPVIEGQDLCGADESESVGVEQHDQVLASIVGEFDVRQFTLRQVRQGFFPVDQDVIATDLEFHNVPLRKT